MKDIRFCIGQVAEKETQKLEELCQQILSCTPVECMQVVQFLNKWRVILHEKTIV